MNAQWPHWLSQYRGERPSSDLRDLEIWGYTGKPSYSAGEMLRLHVSTTVDKFDVVIYRDGAHEDVAYRQSECPGGWHDTPLDAYESGCGWPVCVELEIPEEWRPGGYVVLLTATDQRGSVTQDGFFVVLPSDPGKQSTIAVVLATFTWQEYNDWGGGSGYTRDEVLPAGEAALRVQQESGPVDHVALERSTAGFSPRLSYERPWARGFIRLPVGAPRVTLRHPPPMGWAVRYEQSEWAYANGYSICCGMAGWARHDALFVRWAERNGYQLELLTQWDLDRTPGLLHNYSCVVTVGHDEYWTAAGRRQLDNFIERGGSYARFAGNIMWQIRLEDNGRKQVCYKYAPDADPLRDSTDRGERTGAFEGPEIDDPPVTTFGANGLRGAYSRMGGSSPRGAGGFIVYHNEHWVFAGTDLYYADLLGADVPLVAYEADGVTYSFQDGLPIPTGEDGAPSGIEILALTPVTLEEEDHGAMGTVLAVRDGDLAFVARAFLGADTPEHRERVRRGAAVITWMKKGNGEVFCGGSTEWPYALSQSDEMVVKIAENVLNRFGGRSVAS